MMDKRPALGKGLSALIPDEPPPADRTGLVEIDVDRLAPSDYQPRTTMDTARLDELAASIRANGVIQPIVVRKTADGYRIIAGERRWRAAQKAGLTRVPVVVKEVTGPDAQGRLLQMALIENIQREDLNPLEEARALDRLITEFGITHQQAADAVGRSRAAVSNLLRLLELPPEISAFVEKRELEMGHARALLGLAQRRQQIEVGTLVAKKGLSVRDTEGMVRAMLSKSTGGGVAKEGKSLDPNVQRLQDELSEKLGAPVQIQHTGSGKGKVVVSYHSLDELDGILAHIN
jgi:ParB family transcriptional regulator, chromosome partitioning protein